MCSWCFCCFWGNHVATAAVWLQSCSWVTDTATCLARSACTCSWGEDSSLSLHLFETVGRNSRREKQKRDEDKTMGCQTRIQPAPPKTGECREWFGKQPYKWQWDHISAFLLSWLNREAIRQKSMAKLPMMSVVLDQVHSIYESWGSFCRNIMVSAEDRFTVFTPCDYILWLGEPTTNRLLNNK